MRWQRPFRAHDRYVQYIQYIETLYVLEPYGMEGGDGGNRFRLVVTGKSGFPFPAGRGLVFGPGEWTGTCRGLPRAGMGPGRGTALVMSPTKTAPGGHGTREPSGSGEACFRGLGAGRLQQVDDRAAVQVGELLQASQAGRVVAFFHAADGLGLQPQQTGHLPLGEAGFLAALLQVAGCDHDDVFGHGGSCLVGKAGVVPWRETERMPGAPVRAVREWQEKDRRRGRRWRKSVLFHHV